MKSKLFAGTILGMVLVLGMMVTGCSTGSGDAPAKINFEGTWTRIAGSSNYELTFSGNKLTLKENSSTLMNPTFTYTDTTFSMVGSNGSTGTATCTLSNDKTTLTITAGFSGTWAKLVGTWTKQAN
ncbi:hypothetical protein AGMMS49546_09020 [Spirochaetia bacterium]|nr:hypothetical protein AGMMS49546_09020 [Spirochaetia bacterium]